MSHENLPAPALEPVRLRPAAARDSGGVKRSLVVMASVVTTMGIIAALYWLKSLFIPIAFGVLLAFVMTPLTQWLERRGAGRTVSVVLVVGLVMSLAVILTGTAAYQLGNLLADLPKNAENLRTKVGHVRSLFAGNQVGGLEKLWTQLNQEASVEVKTKNVGEVRVTADQSDRESITPGDKTPVVVKAEEGHWATSLIEWGHPFLEGVTILGFAGVLAVFMLLSREDLRNRLLRILGEGHLTVTTKAVDEATHRISRFLLMQALMNGGYGLVLAIIMWTFGLPFALLGGAMAAVLRYIPFVGGFVAALFPIALTLVQYSSWTPALALIATLIALEVVVSNLLEPWLFGKSMGVSIVAYLVGAAFWTFLWGGIGLVMSGPLTVCLAVIGKYVGQLHFLNILLGDEPVFEREIRFYQRLVANDIDEAVDLAAEEFKENGMEGVYEQLYQPALIQLRSDLDRRRLSPEDAETIVNALHEIADELHEPVPVVQPAADKAADSETEPATEPVDTTPRPQLRLLCVSTRDQIDGAPLRMVTRELEYEGWTPELMNRPTITADILQTIGEEKPHALCLGLVQPGGNARLRYTLKRIGQQYPELKIFVCKLGEADHEDAEDHSLPVSHDQILISTSIPHLLRDLHAWHTVLAATPARAS